MENIITVQKQDSVGTCFDQTVRSCTGLDKGSLKEVGVIRAGNNFNPWFTVCKNLILTQKQFK